MRVSKLMTPDPAVVVPRDSIETASKLMREHGVGMLPVVYDRTTRTLCGLITDGDIATRCTARGHPSGCRVSDHMTPPPLATVGPDDDADTVLPIMENRMIRRAPVVDDVGAVVGVVTQANLALRVRDEPDLTLEQLLDRVATAMR